MKPKFRPTLGDLKEHVTCGLCGNYFTEATTINKCLHTFCHRCIVRHLSTTNSCPTCGRLLHPKRPLSKIRRDRAIQRLVYKIVPGFLKRPEANDNNKELDQELPETLFPTSDYFSICLEQKSLRDLASEETGSLLMPDKDQLSDEAGSVFSLTSDCHKVEEPRYLLCAAIMKLKILKKFLGFKFDLSPHYEIGMICCDQLFDDDHSLLDVAYISKWTMAKPLTLEYLIFDKEKMVKTSTTSTDAEDAGVPSAAAAHPDAAAPTEDLPMALDQPGQPGQPGQPSQPDQGLTVLDGPPEKPNVEPPALAECPASGSSVEPDTSHVVVESEPNITMETASVSAAGTGTRKKKGRQQKPSKTLKSPSDAEIPGSTKVQVEEEVVVDEEPLQAVPSAEDTLALPLTSEKRRGRKRKSDSPEIGVPKNRTEGKTRSKKRSSRSSIENCLENIIPPTKKSPDTTTFRKEEVVPTGNQSTSTDKREVQPSAVSQCPSSGDSGGRIATLKISLEGRPVIRSSSSQIDRSTDSTNRYCDGNDAGKPMYRLQRKDDLRLQLSRRFKPHPVEDAGAKPTPGKKRKADSWKSIGTGNGVKSSPRTKKQVGKPGQAGIANPCFLNAPSEGHPQKVPSSGIGLEGELYPRSSSSRKKRFPAITVTPSPVVFDTDIVTSPFDEALSDKKTSRIPRRKSTLTRIPKAVSISTIPPTFVLTSVRKQETQAFEKVISDGEPRSLKLYLKMADDRKLSMAPDVADDCFTVSSTVADDEAELCGQGSSGNSSDGSPGASRALSEECAEKTKNKSLAKDEFSAVCPVNQSHQSNPTKEASLVAAASVATGSRMLQGHHPLTEPIQKSKASPLSGTSSTKDPGQKRKRLESVISSLKSAASVPVSACSTLSPPPPPPVTPGVIGTKERCRAVFFPPQSGGIRKPAKTINTPTTLLHQLGSREPLNIPIPPLTRSWRPVNPQLSLGAHFNNVPYSTRPTTPFCDPQTTQRQRRPRRGPLRHPFTNLAFGIRVPSQSLAVPVFPRGWNPSQARLRFDVGVPNVSRLQPEANGYDAPLELTTKKSRDASM